MGSTRQLEWSRTGPAGAQRELKKAGFVQVANGNTSWYGSKRLATPTRNVWKLYVNGVEVQDVQFLNVVRMKRAAQSLEDNGSPFKDDQR